MAKYRPTFRAILPVVPAEHREMIVSLCSKLGIPVSMRDPRGGNSWDGISLAVNNWKVLTTTN